MSSSAGNIKRVCETELGIVSQCCQPKQALKYNKQYMENVALKINVKVAMEDVLLLIFSKSKQDFLFCFCLSFSLFCPASFCSLFD